VGSLSTDRKHIYSRLPRKPGASLESGDDPRRVSLRKIFERKNALMLLILFT
jgi:hypothetical protein